MALNMSHLHDVCYSNTQHLNSAMMAKTRLYIKYIIYSHHPANGDENSWWKPQKNIYYRNIHYNIYVIQCNSNCLKRLLHTIYYFVSLVAFIAFCRFTGWFCLCARTLSPFDIELKIVKIVINGSKYVKVKLRT